MFFRGVASGCLAGFCVLVYITCVWVDMRTALCNLHCVWLCSKGHGDPGYDGGFPPFHKSSGFPNSPQGYYNNKKVCSALTTRPQSQLHPPVKQPCMVVWLFSENWTGLSPPPCLSLLLHFRYSALLVMLWRWKWQSPATLSFNLFMLGGGGGGESVISSFF